VDKTIFCVVGDHGEAFGEHGLLGHERIGYDEVYHVPWIIRSPSLVKPATKVTQPVSSVDVTPTLLALLGFNTDGVGFDGINVLGDIPHARKVYFCDWKHEGPTGFVRGDHKFIYNSANGTVSLYDLSADPLELTRVFAGGKTIYSSLSRNALAKKCFLAAGFVVGLTASAWPSTAPPLPISRPPYYRLRISFSRY
jgi:arylsulfatase A-like enzyme